MRTFEFPASVRQAWLYTAVGGGASTVNVATAVRFVGALDTGRLQDALSAVEARHEALRARLRRTGQGRIVQVIHQTGTLALTIGDLPALEGDGALASIAADASAPFHLDRDRLVRAHLYRADQSDHVLCLTLHHAIGDAASGDLLVRDLLAFYRGDPGSLPPLPYQFAEFAAFERAAAFPAAERYWAGQLHGVRVADVPGSRRSSAYLPVRCALPDLRPATPRALGALARRQACPVTAVFAAALLLTLGWPPTGPVVIGVRTANRSRPELRDVVGYLADQVPLVVDARSAGTFEVLAGRAGAALTQALDHYLPSSRLPGLPADPDRPQFSVGVNYLPMAATATTPVLIGELKVLPVDLPDPPPVATAIWPGAPTLELTARDHTGGLAAHLLGNGAALPGDSLPRLAARLAAVLNAAGSNPDLTLTHLYELAEQP